MSEDYTPLYSDATRDAYAGKSGQDSRDYASAVARRVDYKYDLNPAYNEILALIRGSIASGTYRQTWTCLSGDAVGDPIYISAANTVAKADATTAAKAIVVGYIRYKPTTTSCYIDHLLYKSGLSGLTPGAAVFLTDAGGFSATPGTVRREVGIAISATEALLEAYPVTGTQLHASSHITGGSDEIDGDKIDIDWTPSNYTPDSSPTEAGNVDHLTAHLKGIDTELGQKLENMVEDLTPQLGAALDANAKNITNIAKLLIGATAFDSAASLQETVSNTYAIQRILAANDTPGYGAYLYFQRARGTQAARTAPQDGDDLGAVYGAGHTGSAWGVSGLFSVQADGNHGAGSTPGKAGIWTTATGATSATQRIHVDASGRVGIAKLSGLTEILDIIGNIAVTGTVDGVDVSAIGAASHSQNTDTGTTGNTFTIDSDSVLGKIVLDVALGAADKSLTLTNAALTDNRVITFPDSTGTVALTGAAPTAHAASHVTGGGDTIADAIAAGNSGLMSGADKTKLNNIEALADVTDAANVLIALAEPASDVVFNEAGHDHDFRIEAVGVTHALFVQGSDGNVGIGCTPETRLHLLHGSTPCYVRLEASGSGMGAAVQYLVDSGPGSRYNWQIGAQINVADAFEITPSTAVDGTTFTTPALVILFNSYVGIGETAPGTLFDMAGTAPYLTIHNTTEEDGAGGREGKLIFEGEQSGGELTTLGEIEFSHDGASDDEKGKMVIRLNDGNDGASPTVRLTIYSDGGMVLGTIKSGATQVASGAAAGELWKTASHATLPDNVVMIGV